MSLTSNYRKYLLRKNISCLRSHSNMGCFWKFTGRQTGYGVIHCKTVSDACNNDACKLYVWVVIIIIIISDYFSRHCSLFSLKYTVVRSLRTELFAGLWSRGLPAVGREHTELYEGELSRRWGDDDICCQYVRSEDTRRQMRELTDCGKRYVGLNNGREIYLSHCLRDCEATGLQM